MNEVHPDDINQAYEVQCKMISRIRNFDNCKKALDHYLEHKRILATESKRDFSKMTELQLDTEKRNLASLICRRKKTIEKHTAELPEESSLDYRKKLAAINRKKESLEKLILDMEKIRQLLDS